MFRRDIHIWFGCDRRYNVCGKIGGMKKNEQKMYVEEIVKMPELKMALSLLRIARMRSRGKENYNKLLVFQIDFTSILL